jgi:TPR repeat protein
MTCRLAALLVGGTLLTLAQSPAHGQSTGGDVALELRQNVVRVTAEWSNGTLSDGFGFIVGERGGFLYVVTADHVVRGEGPDAVDRSPAVAFFHDQGKEYKAELLDTRLRRGDGDLAVVRVQLPRGLTWRRNAVALSRVKRGTGLWFVGLQRDWFAPIQPGMANRVDVGGTIVAEGLNIKVGTSGGPLISEAGIVGMVVVDTGTFVRATPIDLIERAVKNWNYPWQLGAAPVPVHECDRLAASPFEASRPPGIPGILRNKIDFSNAIPACTEAVNEYPQTPRFAFQLGRAYFAGGKRTEAVSWFRKVAEQGYALAQAGLGQMYETGDGGLSKDDAQAMRLYRLAADQGNAIGRTGLGHMYAQGRGGLTQDDAKAVRLYRLAVDQGYPMAQVRLGHMYARGRGGLTMNESKAVRLYRLAADQGSAAGQFDLGAMYEHGRGGLPRDTAQAERLYRLAAAQGNEHATKALERMANPTNSREPRHRQHRPRFPR